MFAKQKGIMHSYEMLLFVLLTQIAKNHGAHTHFNGRVCSTIAMEAGISGKLL